MTELELNVSYVVYEYISGRKRGERFMDVSSTHYEIEGNIIRKLDSIPDREVAQRIVNNHNRRIGSGLVRGLKYLIFDGF